MALPTFEAEFFKGLQGPKMQYVAPAAISAGEVIGLGNSTNRMVAVAMHDIANGALGNIDLCQAGPVLKVAKADGLVLHAGERVDWDDTANELVAAGTGDFEFGMVTPNPDGTTTVAGGDTHAYAIPNATGGHEGSGS